MKRKGDIKRKGDGDRKGDRERKGDRVKKGRRKIGRKAERKGDFRLEREEESHLIDFPCGQTDVFIVRERENLVRAQHFIRKVVLSAF